MVTTPVTDDESSARLVSMLDRYLSQHPAEAAHLERLSSSLRSGDPWGRAQPLHLTSSGFIVDPASSRVLMRWHERQQTWLQVGGHADPDETDPVGVALREGVEESGLADLTLWPGQADPIQIVIVPVPANDKEPAHEHADVRFVLATATPQAARAENDDAPVQWVGFDEARSLTSEENVREALRRVEQLVTRQA